MALDRAERERRGCEVCGEWFPHEILEWHHIHGYNPDRPKYSEGRPSIANQSRAMMVAEWGECISVCPTCHKVADYERELHDHDSI